MEKSFHGANIRYEADKYSLNQEDIIDFSSNINIFTPEINWEKIQKNIKKNINSYPDNSYDSLKESISKIYNIKKENIFPGNGATELIFLLNQMKFVNNIGIFTPTFNEYERGAKIFDKNIVYFKFNQKINKEDLKDIDLIFICNPNNPTGKIENLEKLLNQAKETSTILVVDETFIDFMYNENYSLKKYIQDYENLVVLSAMTKFFPFTASRLGYLFTKNQKILNHLDNIRHPWSINILAESIIKELENLDKTFYIKTKDYYEKEGERIYNKLKSIDKLIPQITRTNFILCETENIDTNKLKESLLLNHNISIRTTFDYKNLGPNHIRLAIKTKDQNDRLLYALKESIRR